MNRVEKVLSELYSPRKNSSKYMVNNVFDFELAKKGFEKEFNVNLDVERDIFVTSKGDSKPIYKIKINDIPFPLPIPDRDIHDFLRGSAIGISPFFVLASDVNRLKEFLTKVPEVNELFIGFKNLK